MVIFDAALPGTTEHDWESDSRLGSLPTLQTGPCDELIVIAAHPDDETLGAGGLMAHSAALGRPVHVICVTDGAASEPTDTGLAKRRTAELEAAVRELAPHATIQMLGFPDGGTRECRAEIRAAVEVALGTASPRALVVAPWRGDGHRDHRIVGEVTAEAIDGQVLLEYPIWMWHWADPDHPDVPWSRMVSVAIDPDRKARALRCFDSQVRGATPMLRPDFLEHFQRRQEVFITTSDDMVGPQYFEAMYEKSEDPWRFRTRWYEERKRLLTMAVLPHRRYRRGLEIGCSIGVLTDLLASRCDDLLAVDVSTHAVESARGHIGSRATIREQDVVEQFPDGEFDLIVLSEVGYYWGSRLPATVEKIRASLAPGGVLVACHWRHPVADHPLTGDQVHAVIACQDWSRLVHHAEDDFVLEVFSTDARSVAQREGLA